MLLKLLHVYAIFFATASAALASSYTSRGSEERHNGTVLRRRAQSSTESSGTSISWSGAVWGPTDVVRLLFSRVVHALLSDACLFSPFSPLSR